MTLVQVLLTLRLLANAWAAQDRNYGANPSGRVLKIRGIINEFEGADESLLPEVLSQLTDLTNGWEQADQRHMPDPPGSRVKQMRKLLEEFDTH